MAGPLLDRGIATAKQQLHLVLDEMEEDVPEAVRDVLTDSLLDELVALGFAHQFSRDRVDVLGQVRAAVHMALEGGV